MALRGIGAKPLSEKVKVRQPKASPWAKRGLTRAGRVIAFIETLKITSGKLAGKTMRLRGWQKQFIEEVYFEDRTGARPVRTAVLSMARKNGKTGLAAALALCHLLGPEAEPRGEVYSVALTRDQAAKLYAEMAAMLGEDKALEARVNIVRFHKSIEVLSGPGKGSIYSALSADAGSKLGLSPSMVVYDELGAARNRELFDAFDLAGGARVDPLMVVISTQAPEDHHVLSEMIDYGLRVQEGEIEDASFHLTLFAAPEDADPWLPETWKLANPALGDFLSMAEVERQAAQARIVPSKEMAFRNFVLNQRVASESRFINKSEWVACGGTVDAAALRGRECFGGLDLGATRDMTAFCLAFPDDKGGFDALVEFFMPGDEIEARSDEDRVPYQLWSRQGHLHLCPGKTNDPAYVADRIAEAASIYNIKAIAFDRWRIEDMRREFGLIGASLPLTPHGQGYRDFAPAVDFLERAVAEKLLRHGNNPILNWNAANAVVSRNPAGDRKLDKSKATGRIDGLVALTMALHMAKRPEEEAPLPACLAEFVKA